MSADITLYSFPVSHFVEKVRWAMDYCNVDYDVVHCVPVFNIPHTRLKSGARTLPFIECEDGAVADSTHILEWLSENRKPFGLMPADEELRTAAMAIESQIDDVGADVIRYMYSTLIEYPSDMVKVWTWNSSVSSARILRTLFPMIKPLMHYGYNLSAASQADGVERLKKIFVILDDKLSDGREFLVGDEVSIADISAASLLAPIVLPPEHPVYASQHFAGRLQQKNQQFEHYRSFHWLRGIYQKYRGDNSLLEMKEVLKPSEVPAR